MAIVYRHDNPSWLEVKSIHCEIQGGGPGANRNSKTGLAPGCKIFLKHPFLRHGVCPRIYRAQTAVQKKIQFMQSFL
jgi:hypothetical protein